MPVVPNDLEKFTVLWEVDYYDAERNSLYEKEILLKV